MQVRVFERANGTLAVVRAAPAPPGEQADEWYRRAMLRTAEALPALAGLPYVDVDERELPAHAERDQWRLVDGRVVVGTEDG